MENLNHKKALLVLLLVWLVVTFSLIRATYAKYITSLGANADIAISSWNISINDVDILTEKNFSNNFELIFPESEYSVEGVIVPGAVGYFDINVDSSATNVPFLTTIDSTITISSKVDENFIIRGYSINNSEEIPLESNPYDSLEEIPEKPIPFKITNTVKKDTNYTSYRVYLTWIDKSAEEGNASLGYAGDMLKLHVNVKFEQIVLEEAPPSEGNIIITEDSSENSNTFDNVTE